MDALKPPVTVLAKFCGIVRPLVNEAIQAHTAAVLRGTEAGEVVKRLRNPMLGRPGVAGMVEEMKDAAILIESLTIALAEERGKVAALDGALNERGLFINPQTLDEAADEIDCGRECEHCWHEWDTNAAGCHRSERGDYCPNDVAEMLRALAKVSRASALPAPSTAPLEETPPPWIEWNGRGYPVLPDALVHVRFRSKSEEGPFKAKGYRWHWWAGDPDGDIIAYKLAETPALAKTEDAK